MIKGRVMDPNNEPAYGALIVALPMTSYGALIPLNSKEGYFELPWSPTWIDKGQAVFLIATRRYRRTNQGAIVEIHDPTSVVTIRLEPACTLVGKIVDPNDQRIAKYRARLSLPTEFKCQAPIFADEVWTPRVRIFSLIPYGTKYKLTIQAEGYQTKHLTVDATDRSKEIIDVGTITLQPQDPTKPVVAELAPSPDLAKEFHDIYRLEEQEVIVARGRYEFKPHPSGDYPNHIYLTWDGKLNGGGGAVHSLAELFRNLEWDIEMKIVDETEPIENTTIRYRSGKLRWIPRHPELRGERLNALLDNLAKTTSLQFKVERQPAEMWFVTETTGD